MQAMWRCERMLSLKSGKPIALNTPAPDRRSCSEKAELAMEEKYR